MSSLFNRYLNHYKYGPSLATALIGSATVIWQVKASNKDLKNDVDLKIDGVEKNLTSRVDGVEKNAKLGDEHTQSIILGTAYAVMKGLSGKKDTMNRCMVSIGKCARVGGKDCDAAKDIAEVQKRENQKKMG